MNGLNDGRHVSADALIKAIGDFNLCWPHWWELSLAEISVGDRPIQGPLPDPWRSLTYDLRTAFAHRGLLAALNPQPLPPQPPDVLVGLEIADRLMGAAAMAHMLGSWLGQAKNLEGEPIARRLADDVEGICPPYPVIRIKIPKHPWPDPDPDPVIIKLSPLTQLAMGARFKTAATAAGKEPLGAAFTAAADQLTRAGLANMGG